MHPIVIENLSMTYRAPIREAGLPAALDALFRPRYREIHALRNISFEIDVGTIVGFIGPNGAGKTTALKILSGVLHPTGGEARVLGYRPSRRERRFLQQIALIRGSKPLGVPPELTVLDALRFQSLIYDVPPLEFRRNLEELTAMLALKPLLPRQVRALSLGERTRAGLAWSLLYRPRVLFLDEPTIGLDVTMIGVMRRFIADYCQQTGATVILTSHYMVDVETLCQRIVLVDRGEIRYDGSLVELAARISPYKLLRVTLADGSEPDWSRFGLTVTREDGRVGLRVRREDVPSTTARLLADLPVVDLAIEEPPLESVIDQVYREGVA